MALIAFFVSCGKITNSGVSALTLSLNNSPRVTTHGGMIRAYYASPERVTTRLTFAMLARSSGDILEPYLLMNLSGCHRRLAALRAACVFHPISSNHIQLRSVQFSSIRSNQFHRDSTNDYMKSTPKHAPYVRSIYVWRNMCECARAAVARM